MTCIWRLLRLSLLTFLLALQACASNPQLVYHRFAFDGYNDRWFSGPNSNIELQEYDYGGQFSMVHRKAMPGALRLPSNTSINASMPVGEFLYVRWLLKDTGEMVEHRVDLRGRLPKNMSLQTLTFVIEGKNLYVYLVTDKPKKYWGEPPILRTYRSELYVTYEIYPTPHPFD